MSIAWFCHCAGARRRQNASNGFQHLERQLISRVRLGRIKMTAVASRINTACLNFFCLNIMAAFLLFDAESLSALSVLPWLFWVVLRGCEVRHGIVHSGTAGPSRVHYADLPSNSRAICGFRMYGTGVPVTNVMNVSADSAVHC